MTRGDPRGRRAWRRHRAYLIATTPRPVICWRCEQEIEDVENAHLGHVIDLATAAPGEPLPVALEHPRCNLAAGQQLAQQLARRATSTPGAQPPWVSVRPIRTGSP